MRSRSTKRSAARQPTTKARTPTTASRARRSENGCCAAGRSAPGAAREQGDRAGGGEQAPASAPTAIRRHRVRARQKRGTRDPTWADRPVVVTAERTGALTVLVVRRQVNGPARKGSASRVRGGGPRPMRARGGAWRRRWSDRCAYSSRTGRRGFRWNSRDVLSALSNNTRAQLRRRMRRITRAGAPVDVLGGRTGPVVDLERVDANGQVDDRSRQRQRSGLH